MAACPWLNDGGLFYVFMLLDEAVHKRLAGTGYGAD